VIAIAPQAPNAVDSWCNRQVSTRPNPTKRGRASELALCRWSSEAGGAIKGDAGAVSLEEGMKERDCPILSERV